MTTRSLMGAALEYAALGWFVFPLGVGSKRPHFDLLPAADPSRPKDKRTNPPTFKPFSKTAATKEQIREWWTEDPAANIGIICGYSTGVCVVDLDPNARRGDKAYKYNESRRKILSERIGFDETPVVVQTTSGGWHLYYRHPRPPLAIVTQKTHSKGEGVDVQGGANQYAVAPPSLIGRKRYKWVSGPAMELPPPPSWVIASEDSSEGARVYNGHWLAALLNTDTHKGSADAPGRARSLRSITQAFAKRGVPPDITKSVVANYNELHCKPPLSDVAVSRNVAHQYEKAVRDMAGDPSDGVVLQYNGVPFPFKTLQTGSPRIYRWVQTVTSEIGAHPDMVAVSALMGLASAASFCRIEIEGVKRWRPPSHLWGTIVADSGMRKSAVFKEITQSMRPTKDALRHASEIFNNALDTERSILEGVARSAKAKLVKNSGDSSERERLSDATLDLRRLPAELPSSWTTSDATPEALLMKMAAVGWIGVFTEEGADALKGLFGHYSGKSDISGILKGYDLGDSEQDRVGRGYLDVPESRASWLIMTQPSVLADLSRTEAEDRGFLARMQFCIPHEDMVTKLPACPDDPETVFKDFETMMLGIYYGGDLGQHRALLEYEPVYAGINFDDDEMITPNAAGLQRPTLRHEYSVSVSAEVWAVISQFQTEMSEQSRNGASHHTAASWCKKAGEHALRLAVVMELAESDGKARELTTPRAVAAIEIVREYFLYQYYVAVDRMGRPRIAAQALHVLRRFRDNESFSTVDVTKDLRCTTEEAIELCRWLGERGALSVKGRGRNLTCKVLMGVEGG